ncbi:MAG: glycosyl transferase group 1 [Firmicutes bacterium]|nr:glycosyl transferase group 1 [Bacillota bacterium]
MLTKAGANKNKIRVLQILGDPVGGIRKHVHSILLNLDADVFAQSYAYSTQACDSTFREELAEIRNVLEDRIIPLSIEKRPGFHDVYNVIKLAQFIKVNNISIVHGHGAKGGLYTRLLKKICNVKAIYTPHGGAVHRMFSPAADALYTFVERILFNMTDFFIFESKYSAEAYCTKVQKKPQNMTVNYNGVRFPNMKLIEARAQDFSYRNNYGSIFHLGVFGMLRHQKGQMYALQACEELILGKMLVLHFFGDGPDRKKLEDIVLSKGLGANVVFHGDVREVEPHMFNMDAILVPSLFESFGYVAVESMSMQKPVVASAAGGLLEIIEHGKTGLLVSTGDINSIKAAIITLIEDNEYSNRLAKAGKETFYSRFSQERMIENIKKIYLEIANY